MRSHGMLQRSHTGRVKAEAERIRVDTQFKAEAARADAQRTLRDARTEADKILSELASRREAVLGGHSLSATPCLPTALGCSPDLTRLSEKWDDCCSKVEGMADDEISNG
jgi:hypothetical protein